MLESKANWTFSNEENASSIIERLLYDRGIRTEEAKEQFLHPKIDYIQSPVDLAGVEIAKQRILTAMEQEEKVMVYGDYDADGVTSTALLMTALTELGVRCDYYIPNRFDEGYGLNETAIRNFAQAGYSVVVTVDNGIANIAEAEIAKEVGIDLIITDHHEMQTTLPDAYAIIHPKISDFYHFKELAGVGVAFQFAHYLLEYFPTHLLEFVAIGTIADLVPLHEENRILTFFGLQALTNTLNIGIEALKNKASISGEVTEKDVGFGLAPRINAVGRLQNATLAVELLLTEEEEVAVEIAEEIESLNNERKQIVEKIVQEAEQRVQLDKDVIILHDETWHEGVLGIAASRLVRSYNRPVIMLRHKLETNELKGSARSIPAFNLFENGRHIHHLFTTFGGHSQAAGMSFPLENLQAIQTALNAQINEQLTEDDFKEQIHISQELPLEQMTEKLVENINQLSPFGMNNKEPVFLLKAKPAQVRQIGQSQRHLKVQFKDESSSVDAIGFGFGTYAPLLSEHTEMSLVGTLEINEWNGNKTVQIMMQDIAVDNWQLFDYRDRQQTKIFKPYLTHYKQHVFLGDDIHQMKKITNNDEDVTYITYDVDGRHIARADVLYVCDMPDDMSELKSIVQTINPRNIHISYEVTNSAYFQRIPTREEFKWLYGYALKYSPLPLKVDLPKIIQMKKWTREKIIFMLKVFLDLQFITISDDMLHISRDTVKQPLTASVTYQRQLEKRNIEQTLYYATYEEIKEWFDKNVTASEANEEEIIHGL